MTFIKWLITIPFIVGAVLFALANPDIVSITWSPFHDSLSLPLYFVVLAFLGFGFLLGAFMAWIGMGKTRSDRRHLRRENKQLTKDINEANDKLTAELAKYKPDPNAPRIDFDDE